MLKPVAVDVNDFQPSATAGADEAKANNVFKVLHGAYGSLFLSKFASGVLDGRQRDMGVASARMVWAHGLRPFSEATVVAALEQCQARHPEFPPSLPQFLAFCRAAAPRAVYQPNVPALPMGQELRSAYARRAREINAKHAQRASDRRSGTVMVSPGLLGLFQSISIAVGCAGGDEAAELRRLETLYPGVCA